MADSFVHLHLDSHYSFLDGSIKFDKLVEKARHHSMPTIVVTDRGNLFGAYGFLKKRRLGE